MSEPVEETAQDKEQSLMDHLKELRDRLMRSVLSVLIIFACLFYFSEQIFTFVAKPLLALMPKGASMIATGVTSPFLVPLMLVLMLSILLAVPYILHQIWGFIAPGLYSHEKRLAGPLLVSSVILFYCGIAFAYFVIFPIMFGFFTKVVPNGVAMMPDISQYLDFVVTIFFAFGVAFQVPVATFLLILSGVTTVETLVKKRPYIIIAAFVIGMVLTPPDVFSQSLLAIPMWLLFELGLLMSRLFIKPSSVSTESNEYEIVEEDHQDLSDGDMDSLLDDMEAEEEKNREEPPEKP